jgi:hypothetical protein
MPPVEAGLLATGPVPVNQAPVVVSDWSVELKNLVIKWFALGSFSNSVRVRPTKHSFFFGILDSISDLSLAGSVAPGGSIKKLVIKLPLGLPVG